MFYDEWPDASGKLYKNWTFKCPNPDHGACERVMGVSTRNTRNHGHLEPLAYLHVWRDLVPGPYGHRLTNAEQPAVTEFFLANEERLEELWSQFATP